MFLPSYSSRDIAPTNFKGQGHSGKQGWVFDICESVKNQIKLSQTGLNCQKPQQVYKTAQT